MKKTSITNSVLLAIGLLIMSSADYGLAQIVNIIENSY